MNGWASVTTEDGATSAPNEEQENRKEINLAPSRSFSPMEATVPSLICVACHRTPLLDKIVWSDALRQHIHTANRNQTVEGISRICGGHVVRKEDAWRATVLPGTIHLCYNSKLRGVAHLVRLGRPANARNESWTGTPICGGVLAPGHWIPTPDAAARQAACASCMGIEARDADVRRPLSKGEPGGRKAQYPYRG